jgi:cytochrome c oxidase subunit 3
MMYLNHPFHLVNPSILPFNTGLCVFNLMLCLVCWFHGYNMANDALIIAFFCLIFCVTLWIREILLESDYGFHNDIVKNGLFMGIWLMIISESTFFMAVIWSAIHTGLTPTVFIQLTWPPIGIEPISWYQRAMVMTFVLASSFCTANLVSFGLLTNNKKLTFNCLLITIIMGLLFLVGQYVEYNTACFSFSDSVFGSTFYLATGYHGLHVLIAVLYLIVALLNLAKITVNNGLTIHISILIYHIVDIVWLVVYGILYIAVL